MKVNNNFEGVLIVDKPKGITSHDVVARLRRKLQMKRIGHAGTLDPMATGILIMLVGKATKASQYLMSMDKDYEGSIRLGEVTDSQDAEGEIIETCEVPDFTDEQIEEQLLTFKGDQYQTPPMFSAKKVNGTALYKLARKGKTVEREPRFIRVSQYEMTSRCHPSLDFFVSCSKGTYVRTLAHDLGQKLGCGAHLTRLRRTRIGQFNLENSTPLDKIENMGLADITPLLIPVMKAIPSHVIS